MFSVLENFELWNETLDVLKRQNFKVFEFLRTNFKSSEYTLYCDINMTSWEQQDKNGYGLTVMELYVKLTRS